MTREEREEAIELQKGQLNRAVGKWAQKRITHAIEALEAMPCEDASPTCTIDDFIKYAKDKFGVTLTAVKSDNPDTFEKIFGVQPCGDYINIHDAVEVVWNRLSDGYAEKAHSSLDVRDWFVDLPRIKFAEDIVKEMDERGAISVPENCMTGEEYEKWLYKENPCVDAIDRQALRAQFNHLDEVYEGMSEEEEHEAYIYGQIIRAIDDAPSVTPKSLTGHWIDDCPMMTDEGLVRVIRCSHCNEQRKDYYGVSKNYCPKCGSYNGGN